MNQDQIKNLLLNLAPDVSNFTVILTGKKSLKIDGLYKPDTKEILLHNKNFQTDTKLIYTAIHELAHHIHFTSNKPPNSTRAHTRTFWNIFHELLRKAEKEGLYTPRFYDEPEIKILTERIRNQFIKPHGELMKSFGESLLQAKSLCDKYHLNFEDYMDRILQIERGTAKTLIHSFRADVPSQFGYETMKVLAAVPDPVIRQQLEENLAQGYSPDMVKEKIALLAGQEKNQPHNRQPVEVLSSLEKEKDRLERTIKDLQKKVSQLDQEILIVKNKGVVDV